MRFLRFFLFLPLIPLLALQATASECRPKTIANAVIVSQRSMDTITYKGSVYRFAYAKGQRPNEKIPVIYREQGNRCWISWADPGGDQVGLSNGVPRPVAIAFSKAAFNRMIQKKGRNSVQEWVSKLEALAPEDAAALKALGISIPSNQKIRPWNKPEHEEQVR
jgi:hypothetical protein